MNPQNQTHKQIHKPKIIMERFSQLLAAYGGNTKRWPAEERAAALKLVDNSDKARRLQQSALILDNLLETVQVSPPSLMLQKRILAKTYNYTEQVHKKDAWQCLIQWLIGTTFREHIWRPAVVLIIPLLLGILIGLSLTSLPENDNLWLEENLSFLALGPME